MRNRTAEEMEHKALRDLSPPVRGSLAAPHSGEIPHRNLSYTAAHRRHRLNRVHWLARLQALPFLGKMVTKVKEWAMKHQINNICWCEVHWQRPIEVEGVWEALTHLAALSPRGAVVWETRGSGGHVNHLLGADRMYINRIKDVFRTYGNVQFRDISKYDRSSVVLA